MKRIIPLLFLAALAFTACSEQKEKAPDINYNDMRGEEDVPEVINDADSTQMNKSINPTTQENTSNDPATPVD